MRLGLVGFGAMVGAAWIFSGPAFLQSSSVYGLPNMTAFPSYKAKAVNWKIKHSFFLNIGGFAHKPNGQKDVKILTYYQIKNLDPVWLDQLIERVDKTD
jgi:hypothetical protein